jgi:hypothetical protein
MSYLAHNHGVVGTHGLGWLGDDNSTMFAIGFDSGQVQQIVQAHQAGALSDGGYQAILSGFIGPAQLADFMAADPGVTGAAATGGRVSVSNVNATLAPGASPTVAMPSFFDWFGQPSGFFGMPNIAVVGIGALIFASFSGGGILGGRYEVRPRAHRGTSRAAAPAPPPPRPARPAPRRKAKRKK